MIGSGSWKRRIAALACCGCALLSNVLVTLRGDDSSPGNQQSELPALAHAKDLTRDFAVQVGVGFIQQRNIDELFTKGLSRAEGKGEGEIYSLTLQWVAQRFEIPFRGGFLRPQFEPYATLTLVNEAGRSVFPDYNAGIGFRWVDFPWDRWLDTSFFMGLGLSYSDNVFTIDRERHPGMDRSHLKFDWPLQLTFALPRWPRHQLVLFNDHQSGGRILDRGGVNSVGIGYRVEF